MDGLAKTAIMVEKLEGKLWVEKLPGRGNTWWFTFNVEPSHSRNYPFKELSDSGSLPDWSDKTILVVEDVSNNYLLPETLLKPTGVILISAENCIKAGCDRFLSKPLNTSELIRTISELLHKYCIKQEIIAQ